MKESSKLQNSVTCEAVQSFCEAISQGSGASLTLLRAVDTTVDWLCGLQNRASADLQLAHTITSLLISFQPKRAIDPDDVIQDCIHGIENNLYIMIEALKAKRQHAVNDPELIAYHEDCIVEGYDSAIVAFANLHDAMDELLSVMMEHDADLSPITGTFSTPKDLLVHLDEL